MIIKKKSDCYPYSSFAFFITILPNRTVILWSRIHFVILRSRRRRRICRSFYVAAMFLIFSFLLKVLCPFCAENFLYLTVAQSLSCHNPMGRKGGLRPLSQKRPKMRVWPSSLTGGDEVRGWTSPPRPTSPPVSSHSSQNRLLPAICFKALFCGFCCNLPPRLIRSLRQALTQVLTIYYSVTYIRQEIPRPRYNRGAGL